MEQAILQMTTACGPERSLCPIDVARTLAGDRDWRSYLGDVRRIAIRLAREQRLTILRKGKPVVEPDEAHVRGVVRLRAIRAALPARSGD